MTDPTTTQVPLTFNDLIDILKKIENCKPGLPDTIIVPKGHVREFYTLLKKNGITSIKVLPEDYLEVRSDETDD